MKHVHNTRELINQRDAYATLFQPHPLIGYATFTVRFTNQVCNKYQSSLVPRLTHNCFIQTGSQNIIVSRVGLLICHPYPLSNDFYTRCLLVFNTVN